MTDGIDKEYMVCREYSHELLGSIGYVPVSMGSVTIPYAFADSLGCLINSEALRLCTTNVENYTNYDGFNITPQGAKDDKGLPSVLIQPLRKL